MEMEEKRNVKRRTSSLKRSHLLEIFKHVRGQARESPIALPSALARHAQLTDPLNRAQEFGLLKIEANSNFLVVSNHMFYFRKHRGYLHHKLILVGEFAAFWSVSSHKRCHPASSILLSLY